MDIRMINEMEMPRFWTIWVRALREHPEAFGASYEWACGVLPEQCQELLRQIQTNGGFVVGALEDETPIGMLSFTRQQGEKFHHKGDIGAVYVIPEKRASGVGKALLLAALDQTRVMTDLVVISLSVNNKNLAAIHMYEQGGFRAYGVEPKGLLVDGQYFDLLHMTYCR